MSQSQFNRSGTRRIGDDYQDIVVVEFFIDWLEHSDRYHWIEVEADDAGALDDVVALRTDGVVVARQVKYSVRPDDSGDPYTWGKLLDKGNSRDPLLTKWAKSLTKPIFQQHATYEAAVISDRAAGPGYRRKSY